MATALITGGSRGFGRELAAALAIRNWDLVIDGRDHETLDDTTRRLRAVASGRILAISGDVADSAHRHRLADAIGELGGLDLLVNNASILGPSPQPALAAYPLDVLRDVLEINVVAPLALIQLMLPALRASTGIVVNITSDAAVQQYENWGGYGSSKAALEQMSHVLAAEESVISVYWFDPGDMRTRMHQEAFPEEDISDRPAPETRVPPLVDLIESGSPSGRYSAEQLLAGSMK